MPRFVLPGSNGMLVRGTIDIDARTKVAVRNRDGTTSSVRSVSFGYLSSEKTGRVNVPPAVRARVRSFEILAPSVIARSGRWMVVSDDAARAHMLKTGLHLGVFDTPAHATAYGSRLHQQQAAAGRKGRR